MARIKENRKLRQINDCYTHIFIFISWPDHRIRRKETVIWVPWNNRKWKYAAAWTMEFHSLIVRLPQHVSVKELISLWVIGRSVSSLFSVFFLTWPSKTHNISSLSFLLNLFIIMIGHKCISDSIEANHIRKDKRNEALSGRTLRVQSWNDWPANKATLTPLAKTNWPVIFSYKSRT